MKINHESEISSHITLTKCNKWVYSILDNSTSVVSTRTGNLKHKVGCRGSPHPQLIYFSRCSNPVITTQDEGSFKNQEKPQVLCVAITARVMSLAIQNTAWNNNLKIS